MPERVKLTKHLIDAASCPERGQTFLRDSVLPGFALRLTAGSKTFVLERRICGRVRRISLGAYGPITVDQARKHASELIGEIVKGRDPAEARQERRREPTFGDLADFYEARFTPLKMSARNDRTMLKQLAHWRTRKLSAIRRSDVARLHAEIGRRHTRWANATVTLLRTMFNRANEVGLWQGENPATRIPRFKEVERDRFLEPDELARFLEAVRQEPNPYIRAIFLVLVLTGARKAVVLAMRWLDIDLGRAIWRIPPTKDHPAHPLPLPRPLIQILRQLPRLQDNEYVFPGRRRGCHLVNVEKSWARIREKANLKGVRMHDLRRTTGSWLASAGASLPLIGKVLNHLEPRTTQIYARLHLDPVRAALEENAAKMLAVANVQEIQHH